MPTYLVTWKIDIAADSPLEAARAARAIQLRHTSTATVFSVLSHGAAEAVTVDLEERPAYRGAPMGRPESAKLDWGAKLGLRKVWLNAQGYDAGGSYWGIGAPLWQASDERDWIYFRAADRAAAKQYLAGVAGQPLRFWR